MTDGPSPAGTEPVPVAVAGASGRMGRMLIDALDEAAGARLVAATEHADHAWIGQDLGLCLGGPPRGVAVTNDPAEALLTARALLDFTTPGATMGHARLAAQARAVHVIGTTGLCEDDLARLARAARHAVIVRAGNMSLGVNVLTRLTRQLAKALGPNFDIEIVETHHRHKVDAPSGTALMLGAAAAEGRGVALEAWADRGRDGHTGPRREGAIGFAALRGGDVVGEHDVVFAGAGERVVLRHIATDRMIFARGAVHAALWGQNRSPGQYDMIDVLGLND
ncbi:MAG: 4-hydroxy-tetrahydrodipicolinate reductase [Pseudomonadota bacterium]